MCLLNRERIQILYIFENKENFRNFSFLIQNKMAFFRIFCDILKKVSQKYHGHKPICFRTFETDFVQKGAQ